LIAPFAVSAHLLVGYLGIPCSIHPWTRSPPSPALQCVHLVNFCPSRYSPHHTPRENSWVRKETKRKMAPPRWKLIQSGTFETSSWFGPWPSNGHSFQDVLREFLQPIKNDNSHPLQIDPKWHVQDLTAFYWPLNDCSFQDALREFFPPIKNDDPHLDFYTMYKREATQHDTDYVKKYDDLNTTLIFVCYLWLLVPTTYLTHSSRWACSLLSVLHLLLISTQSLSPTKMNNQWPSSM